MPKLAQDIWNYIHDFGEERESGTGRGKKIYKYLKVNLRMYLNPFQMQSKGLQSVQSLPSVPFLSVQRSIQNPFNAIKRSSLFHEFWFI